MHIKPISVTCGDGPEHHYEQVQEGQMLFMLETGNEI